MSTRPRPQRGTSSRRIGSIRFFSSSVCSLSRSIRPVRRSSRSNVSGPPSRGNVARTASAVDPAVERALEHELHEPLQVELMRRHAEHEPRRRRGRVAHRAAVADGAVEADVIDADAVAARDADRQIVARFGDEAERGVAAGQPIAADRRQRAEHPVRRQHAAHRAQQRHAGLAADRSVLVVILDAGVAHRRVGGQRQRQPEREQQADATTAPSAQRTAVRSKKCSAGVVIGRDNDERVFA